MSSRKKPEHAEHDDEAIPNQRYELVDMDLIKVDPHQPRKRFDEDKLKALADSIRSEGLLQPIVIKPFEGTYVIIAGERRWRAFKLLRRKRIPAMIRGAGRTFVLFFRF